MCIRDRYKASARKEAPVGAYGTRSETTAVQSYGSVMSNGQSYQLQGEKMIVGLSLIHIFEAYLNDAHVYYEITDPTPEDNVPIELNNKGFLDVYKRQVSGVIANMVTLVVDGPVAQNAVSYTHLIIVNQVVTEKFQKSGRK